MRHRHLTALALILTACASTGSGSRGSDRDLITIDEIRQTSVATAYDAVFQLRPQFLRPRGRTSIQAPSQVVVYLDNMRLGGVNQLRRIPAGDVAFIEYLSARDATTRWGTGHASGAIHVVSRR